MGADRWSDCPTCEGENLREDYEIGIYNGVFEVDYRGYCRDCGFTYTHQKTEKIIKEG